MVKTRAAKLKNKDGDEPKAEPFPQNATPRSRPNREKRRNPTETPKKGENLTPVPNEEQKPDEKVESDEITAENIGVLSMVSPRKKKAAPKRGKRTKKKAATKQESDLDDSKVVKEEEKVPVEDESQVSELKMEEDSAVASEPKHADLEQALTEVEGNYKGIIEQFQELAKAEMNGSNLKKYNRDERYFIEKGVNTIVENVVAKYSKFTEEKTVQLKEDIKSDSKRVYVFENPEKLRLEKENSELIETIVAAREEIRMWEHAINEFDKKAPTIFEGATFDHGSDTLDEENHSLDIGDYDKFKEVEDLEAKFFLAKEKLLIIEELHSKYKKFFTEFYDMNVDKFFNPNETLGNTTFSNIMDLMNSPGGRRHK